MPPPLVSQVTQTIKPYIPQRVRVSGRSLQSAVATREARRAFARARTGGEAWLDPELIEPLNESFTAPPRYRYSADTLLERGQARAATLRRIAGDERARTLEVGAGDATVSWCLAETGARATAIDLTDRLYKDRVRDSGVELLVGDATAMELDDGAFDMAFSFNSFEHVDDPGAVLGEMLRVVRPGGTVHLDFGPLYFSPYGLHGYRTLNIPYASLLFRREDLEAYTESRALRPIPFDELNYWSVTRFRELWRSVESRATIAQLQEVRQVAGLDLITRHPDCFATKTQAFDDLVVATVRITLRRT
jgi:SAM-dependent methyltransferase